MADKDPKQELANALLLGTAKPLPPEISRSKAMEAAKRRMAERHDHAKLWGIISDYDESRPEAITSDRSTALVLGAVIEQSLETAILTHMIKLDDVQQRNLWQGGGDSAVTFSVKIRLAFALGILGPNAIGDMGCIREVRNLFAHTKDHLTLDDPDVINILRQIKWMSLLSWGGEFPNVPTSGKSIYIETIRHFFVYFELASRRGKPLKYGEQALPDMYA